MRKFARTLLTFLPLMLVAAGCPSQTAVTPPPTITASDGSPTCATGHTCGYIYSWATCTGPTVASCPTPGNPGPGPYVSLQTITNTLSSTNYTGPAPVQGTYVALTVQVVYTDLSPAWVGPPSPVGTPQLISSYPPTLGAPTVTTTAALAPPLFPNASITQTVARNEMPRLTAPTFTIHWNK